MGLERPALGAETEIALALINLTDSLTFSETPYPAIVGSFETITCTSSIDFRAPGSGVRPLRCGLNPAQQLIPEVGGFGRLSFTGADQANANAAMAYNGRPCVARLITKIDGTTVRTYYCSYCVLVIDTKSPEGDEVGTVSGEGEFFLLHEV